mgnify:FL=1
MAPTSLKLVSSQEGLVLYWQSRPKSILWEEFPKLPMNVSPIDAWPFIRPVVLFEQKFENPELFTLLPAAKAGIENKMANNKTIDRRTNLIMNIFIYAFVRDKSRPYKNVIAPPPKCRERFFPLLDGNFGRDPA